MTPTTSVKLAEKIDKLFGKHISQNLYPHELITFADDIETLIVSEQRHLLERVIEALPKKTSAEMYKKTLFGGHLDLISIYKARDRAIDEVTASLQALMEELK